MTGILLTFPTKNLNVEYVWNTLNITENYYKTLKPVENTCKLDAVFSTELSNLLKQYADNNIAANVYDRSGSIIFSGYLRKTFTFTKTQKNKPISLEVVTPAFILDTELTTEVFKTSETVGAIINALGNQAGFTLGCTISNTVDYFRAKKGDKIKDTIEKLLFEYGYIYDFDNTGAFITYPLFNQPTAENITHAFSGADCLEQIQIKRTEKQYTGVTAAWQKKEFIEEALLYEDTTGATTSAACSIDIAPRSHMYGEENAEGKYYLNFDCTKGAVLYASSIWPVMSGTYIENLQTFYENCGDSVLWSAFNPSMTLTATYHKFQWWGRAWVTTSENETKTSVIGEKSLNLSLNYLNDNTAVLGFITKVANYYRYSLFNVTIKSKYNAAVGSFVTVQDSGLGKITGRIISKQSTYTGVFTYTIESVTEYEPAVLGDAKNSINRNASDGYTDNIAQIKSITDSLQAQIDGIERVGTICSLDINTATLEIDDQGFTQTVQSITVFITLKRNERDLDFIVGNTDNPFTLPEGWTAEVDGNKITFTVGEGVQINAGNIKIPVIYTPIISDNTFVDENGSIFVDENGHPFVDIIYGESGTVWNLYLSYIGSGYGRFLGTFTTLQQINSCNPNVSDYFVWGGTNRQVTDLAYEGFLRQAQTYKYIGIGKPWAWEADTNTGHMQAALSDVLAIANADLEANNSTVWQYLDHLTANSIYCGMLVANEAFIESLAAKIVTAELVTTSYLASTLEAYEKVQDLKKTLEGYATTGDISDMDTKTARNKELEKYLQSTSIFSTEGYVRSDFASESICKALLSGKPVITDAGFINTNVLNSDVVTTTYLEGGTANFTGYGFFNKGLQQNCIVDNSKTTKEILATLYEHFTTNGIYNASGYMAVDYSTWFSGQGYGDFKILSVVKGTGFVTINCAYNHYEYNVSGNLKDISTRNMGLTYNPSRGGGGSGYYKSKLANSTETPPDYYAVWTSELDTGLVIFY